VLLPGEPKKLNAKVPQREPERVPDLVLHRTRRPRARARRLPSKATGRFHDEAKAEIAALVERLLAEPVRSSASK
jgi:hypothetical protein